MQNEADVLNDTRGASAAWPASPAAALDWINRLSNDESSLVAAWVTRRASPRLRSRRHSSASTRACMERVEIRTRICALHAADLEASWQQAKMASVLVERWLRAGVAECEDGSGSALELLRDLHELVERARTSSAPLALLVVLAATWDQDPGLLIDAAEAVR